MKPSSKKIVNLLKNPDPSIVIYLFYGSDRGLTNERIKLILQRLEIDVNCCRLNAILEANQEDVPIYSPLNFQEVAQEGRL